MYFSKNIYTSSWQKHVLYYVYVLNTNINIAHEYIKNIYLKQSAMLMETWESKWVYFVLFL